MFLLIDKPKSITSHDVVDRIRKVTGEKKIGHAGTLDPNATGLLIVGVGRGATKRLGTIAGDTKKTYEAEIVLGETRDTGDVDGKKIPISTLRGSRAFQFPNNYTTYNASHYKLPKSQIVETLETFEGEQEQVPPKYSAIKIKGKKSYELARKGKSISLSSRRITIYSIKLISYKFPILKIKTTVSRGTYIRALARDIGKKLEIGAYLNNLRRTKIGLYDVKDAKKLEEINKDNFRDYTVKLD
jgi:tRNA pseudouridine55 synthase